MTTFTLQRKRYQETKKPPDKQGVLEAEIDFMAVRQCRTMRRQSFALTPRAWLRMLRTVCEDGSRTASSIIFFTALSSLKSASSSESQRRALLSSFASFSDVSWYKYLIKSRSVNVFVIGSGFYHFLSEVDERVPHSAQRGVDAHAGAVRYFLKTHL